MWIQPCFSLAGTQYNWNNVNKAPAQGNNSKQYRLGT